VSLASFRKWKVTFAQMQVWKSLKFLQLRGRQVWQKMTFMQVKSSKFGEYSKFGEFSNLREFSKMSLKKARLSSTYKI
jgi:hypothetical protein